MASPIFWPWPTCLSAIPVSMAGWYLRVVVDNDTDAYVVQDHFNVVPSCGRRIIRKGLGGFLFWISSVAKLEGGSVVLLDVNRVPDWFELATCGRQ